MRISNSQINEDKSENDLENFEEIEYDEIPDIDFNIPCEKIPVVLEVTKVSKFEPDFEDIE